MVPHHSIFSKEELLDILFMVSIMATNFQLTMLKKFRIKETVNNNQQTDRTIDENLWLAYGF